MIIATCGHDVSNEKEQGIMMAFAEYSRMGERAVGYPVVCEKCFQERREWNEYLPTKEDEDNWLYKGIKRKK
jgi:hypothetical protein